MKAAWFLFAAFALVPVLPAHGQTSAPADPVFQVDFSDPGQSPSQWTITLHPNGSGHFRSPMGKPPDPASGEIGSPAVDRDIQVSARYAASVFNAAQHHKWFSQPCESHLKVAFQGWKTLSYTGPGGQGSCTFNFSKDKEIENLGESLEAVELTILEGARLELLLLHDRLGLDQESEFLVEAANDGRAQQLCAIHDTLERLAQDDEVLERVRKRARMLLARELN